MATFKKFEEIIAWQKARDLNKKVSHYIDSGRFDKNFRLINQIEGSASSIMDNIAEGFERSGNREFLQFLYIAKGSCGESVATLSCSLTAVTSSNPNLMNCTASQGK